MFKTEIVLMTLVMICLNVGQKMKNKKKDCANVINNFGRTKKDFGRA